MSHTVNITLSFLEKLLHNPFNAVQDCGELTPEQVIVHKALVSGGDKCYKIIQYHTLKCSLIEEQETTVSICISDQPTFNLSKESIITVHQLHYNALVASNGKYDLAFYEVALCQLELILFPGNSKSFNKAQEQYETTYKRLLKNEKDKPELFKQFQEYRQTFNELLNADFPENLYQKILGFVKNILTNDFFIHTYYHELEELFVALLGYPIDQVRSSALVLLNCLYDGHLHQLTTPLFLEKILQVGDLLTWTNTFKHPPFASIIKSSSNLVAEITVPQLLSTKVDCPTKRTTFYTPLTLETGVPKHPGEYDMAVGTISNGKFVQCQCSGGFIQSRVIVLPSKAKKTSIFSISELAYKKDLLTTEMIEENNINLVHIVHVSSVQSRTLQCASFEQELIEHIHDLDIPNVGIMVDFPLEISNKQPETSPYRAFMCRKDTESLAENGSYSFLNYRSLASWDFAVEEIKTLQKDCSVDAIRITSICDSLLPIAPLIPEKAKRITCNIVDPQAICGNDSLTFGYPNPLLRKLTKEIWEINPHFSFFVETPEEEIISSIKSSVIPFIDDLKPLWSPSFKTMFQTSSTAQQIKELESIKEPFYPEKYPQGTIFAYQFQSMHPAIVHFIASLPLIPVLTPLNVYESKHSELNKKRALIRSRDEHLLIFGKIKVLSLLFSNETKADKVVGIMREHSHSATANFIALNTASYPVTVHFDLRDLQFKHEPTPETIFEVIDVVTNKRELMTYNELKNERIMVKLDALDMSCLHVNIYKPRHNVNVNVEHQQYSVKRAINLLESNTPANGNSVYESIADCMKKNDAKGLCNYLQRLYKMLNDVTHKTEVSKLVNMLHLLFYNINQIDGLRDRITPVIGSDVLNNASRISNIGGEICQQVLTKNKLGTVVFITPELGRFSTIGGIGVLINELTKTLAELGTDVMVISPYYNVNKKGQSGYLKNEGINQSGSVTVEVAHDPVSCGIHSGEENNVKLYFLHNYDHFPMAYATGSPEWQLRSAVLLGKASLQLLCDIGVHPSMIVTNDWFTGMTPAYARHGFGSYFNETSFFHIVHNLEKGYIGDLYPDSDLSYIHELPDYLVNNPGPTALNMSMCALKCSDNWGTVSKSYMEDALRGSPLSYHLRQFTKPFACSNGIAVAHRTEVLKKISPTLNHDECKEKLQQKYFNRVDPTIPLYGFVGRICEQKGVFLLLDAIWNIVSDTNGHCQFILGGMASNDDPYAVACASKIREMTSKFPQCFWADPTAFFTDGPLMNLGCDFTCMPSMFEPSGLVQQESFLGGTPVIAFQTGGLKDTVFEFNPTEKTGNGFVFQAFAHGDLVYAIKRSIEVFNKKDDYEVLRSNAAKSVLDLVDVTIAWGSEFCRLKKKVFTFTL